MATKSWTVYDDGVRVVDLNRKPFSVRLRVIPLRDGYRWECGGTGGGWADGTAATVDAAKAAAVAAVPAVSAAMV